MEFKRKILWHYLIFPQKKNIKTEDVLNMLNEILPYKLEKNFD